MGADAGRHPRRLARPDRVGTVLRAGRTLNVLLAVGLAGFAGWAAVSAGQAALAVGTGAAQALWLLPGLVALHLLQLLLSAVAWRRLLPGAVPLRRLYRLRIVREGIDSLLPVAQVGGEVAGARLLARYGPALPVAAASVVVDVTMEFLTQLAFLLAGVAALATVPGAASWQGWVGAVLLLAGLAGALLAAQRFGVLRLLEALARRIAARWPGAAALAGTDAEAAAIYRRRRFAGPCALHGLAWALGTIESWAVLHALGFPVSPAQAFAVEALGMAGRSAGFAVPGALVVQETGFALAAAAAGLPELPGVSLSLVKRVREVVVGLLGLGLWWAERQRASRS